MIPATEPVRHDDRGDAFGACPLCGARTRAYATVASGCFVRCASCRLVHRHRSGLPTPEVERAHYVLHDNDPSDPGYRRFLDRLAAPLAERLPPGAEGLDFGCGPGPTLSVMLCERGFRVADYDPFFAPDESLLARQWDFICCTEAAEHFHHPGMEFERLDAMLRPGGWLGVMTEPRDPARNFESWWYHRDPTHVCFYERYTLEWIAWRYGWRPSFPSRTVTLFWKPRD